MVPKIQDSQKYELDKLKFEVDQLKIAVAMLRPPPITIKIGQTVERPGDVQVDIYTERAHLLALLARHYPAHLLPATDSEQGFSKVLCLHIEDTQCGWHLADSDLPLFDHVERVWPSHYDGHTTKEKYEHIASVARG